MEKTAEQEWENKAEVQAGAFDIYYLKAISDFKAALKEELTKEINNSQWDTYTKGLKKALDLIDQVKPLNNI